MAHYAAKSTAVEALPKSSGCGISAITPPVVDEFFARREIIFDFACAKETHQFSNMGKDVLFSLFDKIVSGDRIRYSLGEAGSFRS